MPDTLLPQLETPEAQKAVIDAVTALLSRWGLHEAKQAELLGLSDISAAREGTILTGDPEILERVGNLLAIGRALRKLFPDDLAADWWVTSPNEEYGGFSPLVIMLGGLDGIQRVRAFLESRIEQGGSI